MKILNPEVQQIYDCQVCQKQVKASKSYNITLNFIPVCSYACFEVAIYKIISQYDLNQKIKLFSILYPYICLFYDVNLTINTQKSIDYDNTLALSKQLLQTIKGEFIIIK